MPRGIGQPPKKKHAKKPRPAPVVPLPESDRASKAIAEYEKARVHLAEAKTLAALATAPNACAHVAYYAMFHAASAAILAAGGVGKRKDVPPSHEHVLEHFGNLVANEPGQLSEAGLLLGRARADRMTADYGLTKSIEATDAIATVKDAEVLVGLVGQRWSLLMSS